jgi:hypothetical protein
MFLSLSLDTSYYVEDHRVCWRCPALRSVGTYRTKFTGSNKALNHNITTITAGISNFSSRLGIFKRTIPKGLQSEGVTAYFTADMTSVDKAQMEKLLQQIREYVGGHILLPLLWLAQHCKDEIAVKHLPTSQVFASMESQAFQRSLVFGDLVARFFPLNCPTFAHCCKSTTINRK